MTDTKPTKGALRAARVFDHKGTAPEKCPDSINKDAYLIDAITGLEEAAAALEDVLRVAASLERGDAQVDANFTDYFVEPGVTLGMKIRSALARAKGES